MGCIIRGTFLVSTVLRSLEGVGQGKGKGNLIGQLIGEQCNSALIQSTLHAPLRQSKLFEPVLCNYFKQFCALILLRKEVIKKRKKERKKT